MSDGGGRVETTPRLAQWRINHNLSPFGYRKSESFRMGLWSWYMSVERSSKQLCLKLFAEAAKEAPPIASFVLKIVAFSPPSSRKTILHPGVFDKAVKNEGLAWATDALAVAGRLVIDVEFLDLKVQDPSGGAPVSIWASCGTRQSAGDAALASLARMLREGVHADITITAADGSVSAHRAVLAARSPVFRSMFAHDLQEKARSAVDIPDMSIAACRALLGFVYGDFRREEFLAHRVALLRAADKYDIADLKEACHDSLAEDIDAGNALERLQIAHLHRLPVLKASCMRYLVDFRKIYELQDELGDFIHSCDRDLVTEVFQAVLAAWNGI